MASFFEKLKKGMGIEESIEEVTEEKIEEPTKKRVGRKPRKTKSEKPLEENKGLTEEPKKLEIKAEPIEKEKKVEEEKWAAFGGEPEGQLAIDVYQTEDDLVIQSAIAGVKPESLDIAIERDVITIKGSREKPLEESGDYFTQECYWGPFSREVILPVEVDPNRAEAKMKEGILTIKLPKISREKKRKIRVLG
jgi:HSP20 family protein